MSIDIPTAGSIPTDQAQLTELVSSVETEYGVNSKPAKNLFQELIKQEGLPKAGRLWMRAERTFLYKQGGLKQAAR